MRYDVVLYQQGLHWIASIAVRNSKQTPSIKALPWSVETEDDAAMYLREEYASRDADNKLDIIVSKR